MNEKSGVVDSSTSVIELESILSEELGCDARFFVCDGTGEFLGRGTCPDCGVEKRMILCLPCKNRLSGVMRCGNFRGSGSEFFSYFTPI